MKKILLLITLLQTFSITFSQPLTTSGTKLNSREVKAMNDSTPGFVVHGKTALHALMAISDAHMLKVAHALNILATTDTARSGNWEQMQQPFARLAGMNVPAVYWFSHPDGTYWTLNKGRATAKLSDREYFPRVLAGQIVIGELVVSHSTNRNTAIVAVPVHGQNNSIIGVLGCSIYLDSLSALIRDEMGGLDDGLFFYSFDAKPLVALHSDPTIIFIEPMKQEDEGLQQAFKTMLSGREGEVNYVFRGVQRTVLYCTSPVTSWWYGLGRIGD